MDNVKTCFDEILKASFCNLYEMSAEEKLQNIFDIPAIDIVVNKDGTPDYEYIELVLDQDCTKLIDLDRMTFGEFLICVDSVISTIMEEETAEVYDGHPELQACCVYKALMTQLLYAKSTANSKIFTSIPLKVLYDRTIAAIAEMSSEVENEKRKDYYMMYESHLRKVNVKSDETITTKVKECNSVTDSFWMPGYRLDDYKEKIMRAYEEFYFHIWTPLILLNTCREPLKMIQNKYVLRDEA